MPVPAIVVHPPKRRGSIVDKVTGGALNKLNMRRRSISTRPPPTLITNRPFVRSVSDNTGTSPGHSHDSYARALPRRGRHTICVPEGSPVLPPLRLGTPPHEFGARVNRELEDRSRNLDEFRRLDFLDLSHLTERPETKNVTSPTSQLCPVPVLESPRGIPTVDTALAEEAGCRPHNDSMTSIETANSGSVYPSPPRSPDSVFSDMTLLTPRSPASPLLPASRASSVYRCRPGSVLWQRGGGVHIIRRKPVKRTIFDMLNGDAYPHIVNKILEHVPPGQYTALRKVCNDMRDWVDQFLCYHITIESYGNLEATYVRLTVSRFVGRQQETIQTRRLWGDEPIETIQSSLVPHHILARTRCVELRGPLCRTDVSQLAEGLLNLQTIRLCENGLGFFPDSCPFVADNVVATLNHDPIQERQQVNRQERGWNLPEGVKRLFLNVRFDGPYPCGRVRPFSYPESLKEVSLRFVGHLPPTLSHGPLRLRPFDLIFQQIGAMRGTIRYNFIDTINFSPLWTFPPPMKEPSGVLDRARRVVTLNGRKKKSKVIQHVGGIPAKHHCSHIPGPMYNANRRTAEAALLDLLRDAVKTHQKKSRTPVDSNTILSHVNFLSLDEYRRIIAPQQFLVETIE